MRRHFVLLRPFAALAAATLACAPADTDIAPNVAARARRAAHAPAVLLDNPVEALVLRAGQQVRLAPVAYDSSITALPGRLVTYRTLDTSVAHVNESGTVLAVRQGTTSIVLASGAAADTVPVAVVSDGRTAERVVVFPLRQFQRMDGWEAHHQSGEIDCRPENFARYKDELFDRAIGELGVNRLRLEVRSGMETPDLRAPGGNEAQPGAVRFRVPWFSPVNDNDDPRVADPGGFQFDWFDYNIDQVVLPLRDRLAARGERLYLSLTYVDFFRSTPFEQMRNPEEYAELLWLTFDHMQRRYGFVPDAVEVLLEPDNTPWTPEHLGRAMVAAGDRLRSAGFTPDFIAPSTTNLAEAVRYYDGMRRVPRVSEFLKVIAYHRYSGVADPALRQLVLRARRDGLGTAMLEHSEGSADELHEDLTVGRVGSWERFALAYCGQQPNPDGGGVYYQALLSKGKPPRIVFNNAAKLLRHYFLFVRRDAVRIAAASSTPDVSPVAFRNTNGALVVILRAGRGADFSVGGLPGGRYTAVWSLRQGSRSESREVTVGPNGELEGHIPDAGFVTIYPH